MKWLITGGCGFIGISLVRQLLTDGGHSIRVVDNLSVGSREDLSAVCDFVEVDSDDIKRHSAIQDTHVCELIVGDILEEELAHCATSGADVLVHLAANTGVGPSVVEPRRDCVTNVIGTLNYLESARRHNVGRFILASSGAPVGEADPPIHEEVVPHPVSPYGASKLAGEAYCSAYFRTYGLETTALRFSNVYGPGSRHKNSVVARFIKRALAGEALEIFGDGTQTRDFIYVDDLVAAVKQAATRPGVGGEVFHIATNEETTLLELVDVLLPILRAARIPDCVVQHAGVRAGDVRRSYVDTRKAAHLLGWRATTPLADGLTTTVRWFVE